MGFLGAVTYSHCYLVLLIDCLCVLIEGVSRGCEFLGRRRRRIDEGFHRTLAIVNVGADADVSQLKLA